MPPGVWLASVVISGAVVVFAVGLHSAKSHVQSRPLVASAVAQACACLTWLPVYTYVCVCVCVCVYVCV